jgi:myo-inositol-1(or 4)-monophosphatase
MRAAAPAAADLALVAERVARAAGELIGRGRPARVEVADTKSSPTDVVTAMDRAAEELIGDLLARARPDDALFGEEGGRTAGGSGLTWVIDPIDGTVNYLYGLPAYAVSVAVVTGDPGRAGAWWPVAGCVHNPATGETWTAASGEGAFLDGVRLDPPPAPDLAQALVGTGFGYRAQDRLAQARLLAGLLPQVRDIRRIGSAALDLCAVAGGRLDAFYERGLNVWDIAAGLLMVTEAGGTVIGPGGGPPSADLVVAAHGPLPGILLSLLDRLEG